MKEIKEQKGITLVALIITIVVLLIVAVVAVGAVKENDIIGYAQFAGAKYTEAQIEEKLNLAVSEAGISGLGKITETSLRSALTSQFGNDFVLTSNGENYIVEISGIQYTISSTGGIAKNEDTGKNEGVVVGLERIYYVVGDNWVDEYVNSEEEIPEEAKITAKFYKTSTPLQLNLEELFGDEAPELDAGYAYKLVIDGEGEMPLVIDMENGTFAAWGKEMEVVFSGESTNAISPIGLYVTEAEVNGVSNVGGFAYHISLSNLKLDNSVTTINAYAFIGASLQNINLKNINYIAPHAFEGAHMLKNITLSEEYTVVGEAAFYGSFIESIDLKNVTQIEDSAFCYSENLADVKLGDNTTIIGEGAFAGCRSLQSIDLKNVTQIGETAFSSCVNLQNVDLTNVQQIGGSAFWGCTALENIDLRSATGLGSGVFRECSNLKTVNLGDNITELADDVFHQCTALENINLKNVTQIGRWCFANCEVLQNIDLTNVTKIGNGAFKQCKNLKNANLSNVEEIGEEAFYECSNLVDVKLGDKNTAIGDWAFYYCTALRNINLENVTQIGFRAFMYCEALQSIELKNITKIEYYAFYECSNLKTIKIKANSLEKDTNYAFCDIAQGSTIYVLNQDVKDALEGNYNPYYTTVEIKTLAEMDQL